MCAPPPLCLCVSVCLFCWGFFYASGRLLNALGLLANNFCVLASPSPLLSSALLDCGVKFDNKPPKLVSPAPVAVAAVASTCHFLLHN